MFRERERVCRSDCIWRVRCQRRHFAPSCPFAIAVGAWRCRRGCGGGAAATTAGWVRGGGGKDPFGISDPAGMQTPTSPSGAESLTTECLSPPFLFPFICPLVALAPSLPPLGRDRTVFRKIPSRVNIAVKCMCMRNYAVINASGHRFSVWKRDARIFSRIFRRILNLRD